VVKTASQEVGFGGVSSLCYCSGWKFQKVASGFDLRKYSQMMAVAET